MICFSPVRFDVYIADVNVNILRNICCGPDDDRYFKNTKSFASLQDRQEKFCRRAIYGMIDCSRNTIFS